MSEKALRIGDLAKRARVPIDTIRYYEKLGLLTPSARTSSGYHTFEPESAHRLRFIRHAQELGFTLEGIGELLALRLERGAACEEVRARAAERLALIERKLSRLGQMRDALAELVTACDARRPTGECPILESLARGDEDDETHH